MALGYEIGTIMKRNSIIHSDDRLTIKLDTIEGMGHGFVQVRHQHCSMKTISTEQTRWSESWRQLLAAVQSELQPCYSCLMLSHQICLHNAFEVSSALPCCSCHEGFPQRMHRHSDIL